MGVEFFSLSKSFNLTGLRVSFLIGNKSIVDALKLLPQPQYDFGISYPVRQPPSPLLPTLLMKSAGNAPNIRAEEMPSSVVSGAPAGMSLDSQGTMFVWLPVPEGYTSVSFTEKLMETTGVIGTPRNCLRPAR